MCSSHHWNRRQRQRTSQRPRSVAGRAGCGVDSPPIRGSSVVTSTNSGRGPTGGESCSAAGRPPCLSGHGCSARSLDASAPPRSHASAQPAGLGAWRLDPCRSRPGPRLSSRRGAARSGRASVGARLQGPPRCLALYAPRDPMGPCLAATPSAGPAHSTRRTGSDPGASAAVPCPPLLLRPAGSAPQGNAGPAARRAGSGSGELGVVQAARACSDASSSARVSASERLARPFNWSLPRCRLDCSTLPPWAASRSPDPGRRRPSRLRSTPGRGAHGRPAQLLFRRGLSRCSAIGQVRRARPARAPPLRPAQRARPQRAHSARTTEHQQVLVPTRPPWATENLQAHHPNHELQATQRQRHGLPGPGHVVRVARHQVIPRPRLVHQRWATRRRQNAPCCSVPGARAVHPPRDRRGENQLELSRRLSFGCRTWLGCHRGVRRSVALRVPRCTGRAPGD